MLPFGRWWSHVLASVGSLEWVVWVAALVVGLLGGLSGRSPVSDGGDTSWTCGRREVL